MTAHEFRLEGRQACLEGVAACVHRQLDHGPFARIEVRLSSQATRPLDRSAVQRRILALLREHGHPQAAVSVRGFEDRLDDALGSHLVRLIPHASRAPTAAPSAPMRWQAWFMRAFGLPAPAAAPDAATSDAGITQREAARAFENALALAMGEHAPGAQVACVLVTVRLPGLHQALGPLLQADPHGASRHVRARLARQGLHHAPDLAVDYLFAPRGEGEGTIHLADSDIEVRLSQDGAAPGPEATWMPHPHAVEPGDDATLLPCGMPTTALHRVRVRVLGTTAQSFDQPVELGEHPLPLAITREWLKAQGFGSIHPALLAGVSQSCPLTVSRAVADGVQLSAAARRLPDGSSVQLYHLLPSRQPLDETPFPSGRLARLSLNHPDGLKKAREDGMRIPSLVLELQSQV